MGCSLFGKLPSKRDFVAVGAPRELLSLYEPWLQGGLTASRLKLAGGWQAAFLEAPLWRFFLGSALCGRTVMGAFMPSVDGVGRYFPLTVLAVAAEGAAFPPPELDPQDRWFQSAEELLLAALDPAISFDQIVQALSLVPPPSAELTTSFPEDLARLSDGTLVAGLDPARFPERLSALRVEDHRRAYARQCVFWTIGGESYAPVALVAQGLPDPNVFTGMLTGNFGTYYR